MSATAKEETFMIYGIPVPSEGQKVDFRDYRLNLSGRTLTLDEAQALGMIVDTGEYPYRGYLGYKDPLVQRPGDWTKRQEEAWVPVYTEVESALVIQLRQVELYLRGIMILPTTLSTPKDPEQLAREIHAILKETTHSKQS